MKTKEFNKKLTLKKETISNLEKDMLKKVIGGGVTLLVTCKLPCLTEPVTGTPCEPCGRTTD